MAKQKYLPQKLKLLITIVKQGKGDFYCDLIDDFGINMQVMINGSGSALLSNSASGFWSNNKDRDIIFSFVPEDKVKQIIKLLNDKFEKTRNGNGVSFVVPISSIIGVSVYQFLIDNRKKGVK